MIHWVLVENQDFQSIDRFTQIETEVIRQAVQVSCSFEMFGEQHTEKSIERVEN